MSSSSSSRGRGRKAPQLVSSQRQKVNAPLSEEELENLAKEEAEDLLEIDSAVVSTPDECLIAAHESLRLLPKKVKTTDKKNP